MEEKKYWARKGEYLVHRDGTIYKMNWHGTGQMRRVKQHRDKQGYLTFWCNGKTVKSHRFIAELFLPNPHNLPQINHKNEKKDDNRVENIEFCDAAYNNSYGTRLERDAKTKSKKLFQCTIDGTFIREWPSAHEVERQLGYNYRRIGECCRGKFKSAYGYVWRYAE